MTPINYKKTVLKVTRALLLKNILPSLSCQDFVDIRSLLRVCSYTFQNSTSSTLVRTQNRNLSSPERDTPIHQYSLMDGRVGTEGVVILVL